MRFFIGIMAFSLLAAASVANAAPIAAEPSGDWQIRQVRQKSGSFGYCLAEARYKNGLTLSIALSPLEEINIGVMVPKAGFTPNDHYKMRLEIDDTTRRDTEAFTGAPDLLLVAEGKDGKLFDALAAGHRLGLYGPEDSSVFTLKGNDKALADLRQCVAEGKSNWKPSGDEKLKAAFPDTLASLLIEAGLGNVEPLPPATLEEEASRPTDYAWKIGPVTGGVRERQVDLKDVNLDKASTMYVKSFKEHCPGAFTSHLNKAEKLTGIEVRSGYVMCQQSPDQKGKSAGQRVYVSTLYYMTDTGLFTLFMHESLDKDKSKAEAATNAILAVVRKIASQKSNATH